MDDSAELTEFDRLSPRNDTQKGGGLFSFFSEVATKSEI